MPSISFDIPTNIDSLQSERVSPQHFEADMLRFVDTSNFQTGANHLGVSGIRYPGHLLVDPNPGNDVNPLNHRFVNGFDDNGRISSHVYDLTHDNLIETTGWPREGLREALEYAVQTGKAFTLLVPQDRYIVIDPDAQDASSVFSIDHQKMMHDLDVFLERLTTGHFGEVPENLTLQIGQEYYAGHVQHIVEFHGLDHEAHIQILGKLYNAMASHIAAKVDDLSASGQNPTGISPSVSVHMGRLFGNPNGPNPYSGTASDAFTLSAQFDATGLAAIDTLLIQRYVPGYDEISRGLSEDVYGYDLGDIERIWTDRAEELGLADHSLDIAAGWSNASLTRGEARARYSGNVTDQEFSDRSNQSFEAYYQTLLSNDFEYGAKHPSALLQFFTNLTYAGVDSATLYGVDLIHAGRVTAADTDGNVHVFAGGTMFATLQKYTIGTSVDAQFLENSRATTDAVGIAQVNLNVFHDDAKTIAYVSVNDIGSEPLQVRLEFAGGAEFSQYYQGAAALSLKTHVPADWRQMFDVQNLDAAWGDGFQSAEAGLYSLVQVDENGRFFDAPFEIDETGVTLTFSQNYEVIQLVMVKTEPGTGQIIFDGSARFDDIAGGSGDDTLIGGGGFDNLTGNDGNDHLEGGPGKDHLVGGAGNDYLDGGGWDDVIFGGDGADTLLGGDGLDQLVGGSGHDILRGGSWDDDLDGGSGNDTLFGDAGRDWLTGGTGHDSLYGGDEIDDLDGGSGDDLLFGGAADDTLRGGLGADKLAGEVGSDRLFGGQGNDELRGGSGHDALYGGDGRDFLYGQGGSDRLRGEAGNDLLNGGTGNDTLIGGSGRDRLIGEDGADRLFGGASNDVLDGGRGDDVMTGGSGSDMFIFKADTGSDVVTDFDVRVDKLRIGKDLAGTATDGHELVLNYATQLSGGVEFIFNDGSNLFLEGVDTMSELEDLIEFI